MKPPPRGGELATAAFAFEFALSEGEPATAATAMVASVTLASRVGVSAAATADAATDDAADDDEGENMCVSTRTSGDAPTTWSRYNNDKEKVYTQKIM